MSSNPYEVIPKNLSGSQVRHILLDLFRNEVFKQKLLTKEGFVKWKKKITEIKKNQAIQLQNTIESKTKKNYEKNMNNENENDKKEINSIADFCLQDDEFLFEGYEQVLSDDEKIEFKELFQRFSIYVVDIRQNTPFPDFINDYDEDEILKVSQEDFILSQKITFSNYSYRKLNLSDDLYHIDVLNQKNLDFIINNQLKRLKEATDLLQMLREYFITKRYFPKKIQNDPLYQLINDQNFTFDGDPKTEGLKLKQYVLYINDIITEIEQEIVRRRPNLFQFKKILKEETPILSGKKSLVPSFRYVLATDEMMDYNMKHMFLNDIQFFSEVKENFVYQNTFQQIMRIFWSTKKKKESVVPKQLLTTQIIQEKIKRIETIKDVLNILAHPLHGGTNSKVRKEVGEEKPREDILKKWQMFCQPSISNKSIKMIQDKIIAQAIKEFIDKKKQNPDPSFYEKYFGNGEYILKYKLPVDQFIYKNILEENQAIDKVISERSSSKRQSDQKQEDTQTKKKEEKQLKEYTLTFSDQKKLKIFQSQIERFTKEQEVQKKDSLKIQQDYFDQQNILKKDLLSKQSLEIDETASDEFIGITLEQQMEREKSKLKKILRNKFFQLFFVVDKNKIIKSIEQGTDEQKINKYNQELNKLNYANNWSQLKDLWVRFSLNSFNLERNIEKWRDFLKDQQQNNDKEVQILASDKQPKENIKLTEDEEFIFTKEMINIIYRFKQISI